MKVAIIHYWLVSMRGGEKVLESLCELYPQADIYTHVYDPQVISEVLKKHTVRTTFINRLPFAKKFYQKYLSLMPAALEALDLRAYDLIISSESGPAKGILCSAQTPHLCYCHTPMRYLWDYYHHYLATSKGITRFFFKHLAPALRQWDLMSSYRVDHFIANSHNVAKRIKRIYGRESTVIYPPVDVKNFDPHQPRGDFYLVLGQITAYKRVDLAIKLFSKNGKPLVIAGGGDRLIDLPNNITVKGSVSAEEGKTLLQSAKALIFPGEEDFGIVPVEAIAAGAPVLAYGKGGALETVQDGVSGLFFYEQTVEALAECVEKFEKSAHLFSVNTMHKSVMRFDKSCFLAQMKTYIQEKS
jgi:glycosyltransferase involved in cell wall biosynthesis